MNTVRIILLCVAAAFVCVLLRQYRPEFAGILSLAVGIGVLLIVGDSLQEMAVGIKRFLEHAPLHSEYTTVVLKAAGISILSELGVQICCDAGESALAGRIKLACRITMLMLALPGLSEILDSVGTIAG